MRLILDGDNVLRALGLVRGSDLTAAERFLQRLERIAVSHDWEVVAIFDGPERFFPRPTGPLVVQYAPPRTTADTVIERMVCQAQDRADLVVVTRDRAQADLVLGFGALVWTPQRLLQELQASDCNP
jgi:predicted RNA-binding protein with PIN domain